jgi:hypothetical protein
MKKKESKISAAIPKYFTLSIFCVFFFLTGCGGGIGGDSLNFTMYWGVAVDDLDQDGAADIVVTLTNSGGNTRHYSSVILNDPALPGSFFLSDEFKLQGAERDWPTSVTLGDLNDDGFADIATQNKEAIFILFQDSTLPGQFFVPLKIVVGTYAQALAIGDLNEDGFSDLAIAGGQPHLSILFQDSFNPGNFLSPVNLSISSSSVAIGDLDGDSINDMAVTGSGKVRLLFQDSFAPGSFLMPVDLDVGVQPTDVRLADLDKDNRLDLIVGHDDEHGGVSVSLQHPINAGQFLPADNYNFSCSANGISLGDLNDDGFLDIAVASWCYGNDCEITILFQDIANTGSFLPAVKYSCDDFSIPSSIAVGDVNNDNFNDLIVLEEGVVIRLQDASSPGTFQGRIKIYDPD